jgi:shikimate kinase
MHNALINNKNIFIWGFMGTGKSTLGRRWAALLNLPFVDLDDRITQHLGLPIPEIFRQKGEDFFRQTEAHLLRQIELQPASVVACGGGTPCFLENADYMLHHGYCVWLRATPDLIMSRLSADKGERPLLPFPPNERLEYIAALLQKRLPFYSKAHLSIEALGAKNRPVPPEVLRFLKAVE